MESVKVGREELLKTLKTNRDNHRKIFEEALEGYREEAIKELEGAIADAKSGKKIRRNLTLVEPMDQTKDYDRVIRMLEMSKDAIIEISEQDFACYVLDDWRWKDQFTASNTRYLKSSLGK